MNNPDIDVTDDQIRAVFLANGFTVKEGQTDLKPYVFEAARALLALQQVRIDELKTICAESYQVVGSLAETAGKFNTLAVEKALDNLSQQYLVHTDVLPFYPGE